MYVLFVLTVSMGSMYAVVTAFLMVCQKFEFSEVNIYLQVFLALEYFRVGILLERI